MYQCKIGNVNINSGDWIYVDTNGWVVTSRELKL
jgi:regulator of RNase E activity RraA